MNNNTATATTDEFTAALASSAPTPGGGGAAAVIGAQAAALASMAASLTVGKKKYASFEEQHKQAIEECGALRKRLLQLADEDAAAFLPLRKAYSIPAGEEGRKERMDEALRGACVPPLEIMTCTVRVIELLEMLAETCAKTIKSDAAAGAYAAVGALQAAACNVFVNAASFSNPQEGRELKERAESMIEQYVPRALKAAGKAEESYR